MNSRERTLAITLLSFVLGGGGLFFANLFFFKPLKSLDTQIAARQADVDARVRDIKKEDATLAEIEKLSPRVAQWKKTSLPDADRKADAFAGHLSRMKIEYQQYLSKLLNDNGFKARQVKAVEGGDPRAAANARVKPAYQALGFSVQGDADVPTMMKVFHAFYSAPLLHQIKTFSITAQRTSTNLDVKMTVEVLLVTGAEKRVALLPSFDSKKGENKPVLMARSIDTLKEAGAHPLFHPPEPVRPPPTGGGEIVDRGPQGEDPQLVLEYVHLSAIYYSEYHGAWLARLSNADDREDGGVWVADKPLPPGTKFQADKKKFEDAKKKNEVPNNQKFKEPVQNWVLKDRKNVTVIDLTVARIDPLRIVISSKDRFYAITPGKTLWDALATPLKNEELAKMGLAADKDEVLKRVKLDKVENVEKNKRLEATFVNPGAKEDKKMLSDTTSAEEFFPPDEWKIRDTFGSEILKIVVLRVDANQKVYFTSDKKLYCITPGATLFDAMAKPLTEEEANKAGFVKKS